MFPNPAGGAIVSKGLLEHVGAWTAYCLRHADATEAPRKGETDVRPLLRD